MNGKLINHGLILLLLTPLLCSRLVGAQTNTCLLEVGAEPFIVVPSLPGGSTNLNNKNCLHVNSAPYLVRELNALNVRYSFNLQILFCCLSCTFCNISRASIKERSRFCLLSTCIMLSSSVMIYFFCTCHSGILPIISPSFSVLGF